ncbi:MAG: PQQ-binding-like beta-propeller repeat protein, partial [Pseudomonadota bacterium]
VTVRPETQLLWAGEFQFTSPPVIVGDVVIVGSAISDNARRAAPHGTVRAFNVRTGAAVWSFDPIPRTADAPTRADWPEGAAPVEGHANVWAPMSADLKRGLVFLPTSSPSPDFYGGLRAGDNRHANSVVALEAATGAVRWAYQIVHHDVWDYDLPAQPGLYQVWRDGRRHDVVAQVTKTGHVFVLDRDTGAPFLPIEERPAPQDGQTGEVLSATQPFPVRTPALVPDRIAPGDAFGLTWFDKRACAARIKSADAGGLFTPPSERGALIYPANSGGANWGGAAFDPSRNLLVVNMSNIVHHVQLIAAENVPEMRAVFHDSEVSPQSGAPYGMKREVLVSPLGLPCNPPPWGVIAGVDLASGAIVWRKRFGTTQDLAGGLALPLGTPNFGGPIITSGGLIFIGATMDNYLRAFDIATGAELWKGRLPAGGQATPMTYEWEGRQYVVIYAGGHARAGTTLGDSIVAFALP